MFYRKHKRVLAKLEGESMTKQSFRDECDIHKIIRSFSRTGIITHVQSSRPTYTDLPSGVDFQNSLHVVMEAQEAFSGLPSVVRNHFGNNPANFLAAMYDDKQRAKLEEFGLLKKPDTKPAQSTSTVAGSQAGPAATPPAGAAVPPAPAGGS